MLTVTPCIKTLVLCHHGSQGTPRACSSRRRRGSPLYLGKAVTTGPQTRCDVAVLGRLAMFHTTKEPRSCLARAPISMWRRLSRHAPHPSAAHALRLTMPVSASDHAPASPHLDWEAREPTRRTLQHAALPRGVVRRPRHALPRAGWLWVVRLGPDAARPHALFQARAGHDRSRERCYGIPG
jgi:hypothetical protein